MCAWSRGDVRRNWGHARGRSSRKRASERLREGTVGRGQGERGAACRRPVDHAVSKTSPKARGCPCAGPRLSASVSVPARPTARHARSCRSPMRARGAQSNMTGLSGSRHNAQKKKKTRPHSVSRAQRHVSHVTPVWCPPPWCAHTSSDDDMSSVRRCVLTHTSSVSFPGENEISCMKFPIHHV